MADQKQVKRKPIFLNKPDASGPAKAASPKPIAQVAVDFDKTPFMEPSKPSVSGPGPQGRTGPKPAAGSSSPQAASDLDETPYREPSSSLRAGAAKSSAGSVPAEAEIDLDATLPKAPKQQPKKPDEPIAEPAHGSKDKELPTSLSDPFPPSPAPGTDASKGLNIAMLTGPGNEDDGFRYTPGSPGQPPRNVIVTPSPIPLVAGRQSAPSVEFSASPKPAGAQKQAPPHKSAVSGASAVAERSFATEPSVVIKTEPTAKDAKPEKSPKKMDWFSFATFFGGAGLAPAAALYLSGFANKYAIAGYVVFELICTAFFSYRPDRSKKPTDAQSGNGNTGPNGTMISGGSS